MKDPYAVLGVPKDADDKAIKAAYRKLAREHHPDLNPGDTVAEERFKEASAAFDVLSDGDKRKLYDEFGEDGIRQGFDPDQAREYRRWRERADRTRGPSGFGGFGGGASFGGAGGGWVFDLDDILGHGFGGMSRGADIRSEMTLPFLDAVRGTERSLRFRLPGSPGPDQHLKVRVPPGIPDGGVIRLKGKGEPPDGDLLITVHVTPHPLLRRQGNDLHLELPVTLSEAMFGAKVSAPTLSGAVRLTIPKGAQSGQRLRLKGKGVPGHKKRKAGDLYVTVRIALPDAPDEDDAEASSRAEEAAATLEALYAEDVRKGVKL